MQIISKGPLILVINSYLWHVFGGQKYGGQKEHGTCSGWGGGQDKCLHEDKTRQRNVTWVE